VRVSLLAGPATPAAHRAPAANRLTCALAGPPASCAGCRALVAGHSPGGAKSLDLHGGTQFLAQQFPNYVLEGELQADPEQQQADWYAHTATEILVVGTTADTQLSYAVAAARLCDHTIAWDSRTRYPVPLHGAYQMDKDHPEYCRTIEHD
jgi:RNase H domain-containing protein